MYATQRVLGDGACLYRAVAVGLIHRFTGINVGGGSPLGMETTYCHVLHNVVVRWVRGLCVAAMCGDGRADITTVVGRQSLFDVLRKAGALLRGKGGARAPDAREKADIERRLAGGTTAGMVIGTGRKVFAAAGESFVAAELVDGGGDHDGPTFRQHCRRMMDWTSWGGEAELFVLCTEVLGLPVAVYEGGALRYRYAPAGAAPARELALVYNGNNHYDALLETDAAPLIKI